MEKSLTITNVDTYLTIAQNALETFKSLDASSQRPLPDGSGSIITYDPDHSSFKQSIIAIVFAGVYLDALLYIVGTRRLGPIEYEKIERREYEVKLRALQITDPETLQACTRFREARNDIVHEKAAELVSSTISTTFKPRFAQTEAEHALTFVTRVAHLLRVPVN